MSLYRFPVSLLVLAVLLVLTAVMFVPGSTVLADTSAEGPHTVAEISDLSRVTRVAEALQEEPVYLSHLVDGQPYDEERLEMITEVSAAFDGEVPLYVVMYAAPPTDETGGQPTLFLHALHEVSGADGVYVAMTTDRRFATAAFNSPVTPVLDEERFRNHRRPVETVSDIVAMMEESPRTPVEATPLTRDPAPEVIQETQSPMSEAARFWELAIPGALFGLLAAGAYLRWTSRELSPALSGGSASVGLQHGTHRWFAVAARGSRWRIRRRLARELRSLRREFESAAPDHRGLPRAREAYDAAGLIATSPGIPATALVCGMILARHGRRALVSPDEGETIPCRVNPLHGPATGRHAFYLGGRLRRWQVCRRCMNASVRGSEAMVLRRGRRAIYLHDIDDPWVEVALAEQDPFARARTLIGVRP